MTSLCTEYWQTFLTQAVGMGASMGLMFMPAISVLNHYCKPIMLLLSQKLRKRRRLPREEGRRGEDFSAYLNSELTLSSAVLAKRSFVMGIAMSGASIGGIIFPSESSCRSSGGAII